VVAAGSIEEPVYLWMPESVPGEDVSTAAELYYNGLAGQLVGVTPDGASALEALGGRPIDLGPEETIYVALVEDADRADFEPPARVLLRAGHEVLLATPGAAPRLTETSARDLEGLQELVRVDRRAIAWPVDGVAPPALEREANPLIADMVDALTEENYVTTWQILDDFQTRYTFAPENEASSQWMLEEFLAMGLAAEFHEYNQDGIRRNVIATHPGLVDPTKVVYICGHFDAISEDPYVCAPGADDNGSGTAAVIEAARVCSQYFFEYTIKFACFNGEEQGLYGSAAYVADIAAAGEDVVGAYNCDMIAYRGNDPAPPDLVLYTNNNSVELAYTLETAVGDYLPDLLEPIVLVEALNASDHASFWNHGYRAICAIEEEAWGADFCPWYHTCADSIEQYPHDYPTYCAKANLAAVAMTALPVNPEGSFLAFDSAVIDDDVLGDSDGNADGDLNPGETIEFWVTVRNLGQSDATNVSGVLSTDSESATILNDTAQWNDVPSGGEGMSLTPFLFSVAGTALDAEQIPFTLAMTDDLGVRELSISLPVVAPVLVYHSHGLDDGAHGNGNGLPEPGEVLVLPVTLANTGGQDAVAVEALLSSTNPHLIAIDDEAGAFAIAAGAMEELVPPYRVALSVDAVDGEEIPIDLTITTGGGYQTSASFKLRVGSFFYDDVEVDGAWSLAAGDDDAIRGRWVRVDPIGTYQGAEPCQPEDDHTSAPGTDCFVTGQGSIGGSIGEADVDGGKTTLMTPVFDLTQVDQPEVRYWRWYTNDLGNNPGEDTWVVQISSDGGQGWVDLERTTASENSWVERSFVVSDYVTPSDAVVVRFVASDEINGSLVEAGVDDFLITGAPGSVGAEEQEQSLTLRLDPVRPNPTTGGAVLSFALPSEGHVALRVYGVDGRLVRTLVDGDVAAGLHRVDWDGRGDGGAAVAPGIYFAKMDADGKVLKRRVVLVK
jgi:hypothetical protein